MRVSKGAQARAAKAGGDYYAGDFDHQADLISRQLAPFGAVPADATDEEKQAISLAHTKVVSESLMRLHGRVKRHYNYGNKYDGGGRNVEQAA